MLIHNKLGLMLSNKVCLLLAMIIVFSFVVRVYKIDSVPPSLSWDEAAVGYNAYTIGNWGRDEYGKLFPAYFKSFGDDKHPVYVYATAFFVKLMGLSELSTRLPAAIFGVLNVLLIFFLAKLMFSSRILGLIAAFFLAVSPYNIHFSRFNHEANFALFFFILGLTLFYLTINKNNKFLPLSVLSFGISIIAYHPSKIVVPVVGLALIILYGKQIFKKKQSLFAALSVILVFFLLIFTNPQLLGIARINQTSLGKDDIKKTEAFKLTNNELLGHLNLVFIQYSWLVSPKYLFISGDKNPRLSDQATGQFYKSDAFFLLLGVIYMLYKRSKASVVLLVWALVAPFPSALVGEAPHAARAMFMMGSWHLISALGLYSIYNLARKPFLKIGIFLVTAIILFWFLSQYLKHYYGEYAKKNAIDWQYGMKQIVEYVKDHREYGQVYTTAVRSQPYIFFLYYLKEPLPDYLNTVIYNNASDKSYNTVAYFGKYSFSGWNPIESQANKGVLYVLSPSEYDGLNNRLSFDVKKVVYYPNGTDAFSS
ncbi:MAG: glycosyltransferase family 39 protein, partial [Actinobacteria bacterium]|nr:glycosyltransferase family 39 protein [Actinomycetota bacterium]